MTAFVEEIVEAFRPQFAACEALLDFAKANRPEVPPEDDLSARLLHRTYVRGSKTFQAAYLLAGRGYGVQAGMLNRSLYEDMLVAHWISVNPQEAPEKYERHRKLSIENMRASMQKHRIGEELMHAPVLTPEERKAYAQEFGNRSWTGRSLDEIARDVEREWAEGFDRDVFWWAFDIAHRFNNLLIHHTAIGLGLASEREDENLVRLDVGPSKTHVHGALFVAFFSYGHLISLVLEGEQFDALSALFSEHLLRAFTKSREDVPVADEDGKPVESNSGEDWQTEASDAEGESAISSEAEGDGD